MVLTLSMALCAKASYSEQEQISKGMRWKIQTANFWWKIHLDLETFMFEICLTQQSVIVEQKGHEEIQTH